MSVTHVELLREAQLRVTAPRLAVLAEVEALCDRVAILDCDAHYGNGTADMEIFLAGASGQVLSSGDFML